MVKFNNLFKHIISCILLCVTLIVIQNKLIAQEDPDKIKYDVCPGWGYKCISITKDTIFGSITLPVRLKGKDRGVIEPIQKE